MKIGDLWCNAVWQPKPLFFIMAAVLLLIIGYVFFRLLIPSPIPTRFWYAGVTDNRIGTTRWEPDHILDMEFGLSPGDDCLGKTLRSVQLKEVDPNPRKPSYNLWTTDAGNAWKITLWAEGQFPCRWDRGGEPLHVPLSPSQKVRIFVGNPHRGSYIPEGMKAQITLFFTDDSNQTYTCLLLPQGNH